MAATFAFTINGVSRLSGLQAGTLRITKSHGRRSTLQCQVFSTDGSWHPTINQEVVWSTDGTARFGGYIREITYLGKMLRNSNSVFYDISCGDYGSLLEDRLVTEEFPAGQTLKQWLTTFVTNWLTIKGISLDAAQTDGPTMSQPLQVERMRADVVLQQILLRSEYVTRGISATKTLLLFSSGSSVAPFNLTSTNRKALGDIQVSPLWNGQKYNRVIIKFGVAGVVEYFYQDAITVSGTPTSITLNYTPVGWYPVTAGQAFGYGYADSSINGRAVVATDPSPYTSGYEFFPTTNTLQKFDGSAFANGEVITIPYDFRYPIEVIEETAGAATDPIELLVIDESIRTNEEAELKAQRILAIVQTDTERVHYYTAEDDLDVAQTQNINIPERFFNDDCIITDLRTSDTAANTGDSAAVQFKLVHEIFATQGDQPKRTELDTVMQWSMLGSGSGAVPGTAPNSGGGIGPAPPRYSLQFNNPLGVFDGAEQVLYTDQVFGGTSAKGLVLLDKSVSGTYTSATPRFELGVTNTDDVQMAMFGGSYLIDAEYDVNITAGSISGISGFQPGAVGIGATDGIGLDPGNVTSEGNSLGGMTMIDGFAVNTIRVTSLPFTMDASMVNLADLHTAFIVDTVSAGTFNLAGLSAVFTTRPNTSDARLICVKKLQSGTLTLDGDGTDTINGSAVMSLAGGDATWLLAGPQATTNWQTVAGTGSGAGAGASLSVPGNDGDVLFNASGTLSAVSQFNWNDGTGQLRLTQISTGNAILVVSGTGTSVGGPLTYDTIAGSQKDRIGLGLEAVSGALIARVPSPGTIFHSGASAVSAEAAYIGHEIAINETVGLTLTQSALRGAYINAAGAFQVYQTGGLGASATGCGVYVDRNDSNSAAPAWLGLENRSAIPSYLWSDTAPLQRIGLSAPTADNAVSVGSGYRVFAGQFVRKTADESVSSTSALQNDDELLVAIGANETWIVEFHIAYNAGTGGDIKWSLNVPSGATGRIQTHGLGAGAATIDASNVLFSSTDLTDTIGANFGGGGSNDTIMEIKALIINGATPGNVQFRFAQLTSSGTATIVRSNSYALATRVA